MFNLEQSISAWRTQMLAAGITADDVAELESHLREDIGRQTKFGLAEHEAFTLSTRRIGPIAALRAEFTKTNQIIGGRQMTHIIATIAGLFGMAFGLGFILPALAKHNHHPELWTRDELWPISVGFTIIVLGAIAAFYCIRTRREARGRVVITLALLISSAPFFGSAILTLLQHTGDLSSAGWVMFIIALLASIAFFGSCFRYNWNKSKSA
jgi:uncharacterized membrane protein